MSDQAAAPWPEPSPRSRGRRIVIITLTVVNVMLVVVLAGLTVLFLTAKASWDATIADNRARIEAMGNDLEAARDRANELGFQAMDVSEEIERIEQRTTEERECLAAVRAFMRELVENGRADIAFDDECGEPLGGAYEAELS